MKAYPSKKRLLAILPFLIFLYPAVPLAAQQSSDAGNLTRRFFRDFQSACATILK